MPGRSTGDLQVQILFLLILGKGEHLTLMELEKQMLITKLELEILRHYLILEMMIYNFYFGMEE